MPDIKKVVLAYSGGLDTSVILKWLQDTYSCEVVTFTADIGQGEELAPARAKAKKMGVKEIFIDDLREEFVRDFVFPMFRANAIYEGEYLLGTSIARPLIAKRQIEIARKTGADAVTHGATGKGNDQVRFELGYYALEPDIRVIAPWREWDLTSRETLLEYAEKHGIPVEMKKKTARRTRWTPTCCTSPTKAACSKTRRASPKSRCGAGRCRRKKRPNRAEYIELEYRKGDIVAINGKKMTPAKVLAKLNKLGGKHGIGRLDLVENRYVGMKSRGCYETPGGTIMLQRAPRDRVDHARPRSRAPEGRPDAALRRADLQRLLVEPRAQDAADHDRRLAGERERLACASSSTRATSSSSAASRNAIRCSTPPSPPSRTTRAPTTRRTPPASSGSTRCACASPPICKRKRK